MMIVEPREDEMRINIITRSGVVMGGNKGKKKVEDSWVRKITEKVIGFNIQKEKENFMRVKQSFMDAEASTSSAQPNLTSKKDYNKVPTLTQELDPNILKSFSQNCMKFLRN